jgi:hypothetical protein
MIFLKPARSEGLKHKSSMKSISVLLHARATRIDQAMSWTVFLGFFLLMILLSPGLDYFLKCRDHGYQLCVATQILLGKIPGIDVIIAYGPMAMYTSALGLKLTDSLIGETVLCAGGYSLSMFLIYWLVRNHSNNVLGLVAAWAGYLVEARFYKWYVWLIPLGSLWALHCYLLSPAKNRMRWAALSGVVIGLGWLYRLDMGTLIFASSFIFIALIEAGSPGGGLADNIRILGAFTASFTILPLCWFGYLAVAVSIGAPIVFLRTTIEAALAVSGGMAQPLPPFRVVVLAYILVPTSLLLAAGLGISREWIGGADTRSRFLLAAALIGLSIFHQAMHRKGPSHLLQVVPPFIISVFLLLAIFLRRISSEIAYKSSRLAFVFSGLLFFLLSGWVGAGLARWGRLDLIGLSSWSARRYFDLAHPLGADDRYPVIKTIHVIREQTKLDEPILVFPLDCQLYTLAHRKLSGRHYAYYAGVFDAPRDQSETLKSICKEMPALVVLPSNKNRLPNDNVTDDLVSCSRLAHRYLEDFIREHYPHIVYEDGEALLLSKKEAEDRFTR